MVPNFVEELSGECVEASGLVEEEGVSGLAKNLDGGGFGTFGFEDLGLLFEARSNGVEDGAFAR